MATPIWAPGVNGPELPNTARVRDYWLGGTHNTEADQDLAAHLVSAAPHLPYLCRTHRSYLGRVVRRLTALGVRQFIDLGSGLPTAGNVHLVAPGARVVYVEIDPAVAAEGRSIVADEPRVEYLCADLCDPEKVLDVLHFVPDSAEPHKVLSQYVDALAPGSHLGLSHTCRDPFMLAAVELFGAMYGDQPLPAFTFRYPEQVVQFFDDMELLEPGVVPIPLWDPDPGEVQDRNPENFQGCGGLARKL